MTLGKTAHRSNSQKGFTLVELMMSVLIFGLVMAGVFTAYRSQQRSQTAQEAVADMQQNIRAAMVMMSQDIREAGCDPTSLSGAGVVVATPGLFQFTRDIAGDPVNPNQANGSLADPNENVTYGFSVANDAGRDGIADAGVAELGRDTGGGFQPIAENISAIEFNYMLDDGVTITTTPNGAQLAHIARVQVSVLARAGRADPDHTDSRTYTTAAGTVWGPFPDNFRRKIETITIQIRNKF
jgi:type IV pilus assembly protein PilW